MTAMTPEAFAVYMNSPIEYELGKATREGIEKSARFVQAAAQAGVDAKAPNGLRTGRRLKEGKRGKITTHLKAYGHVNAFAVVFVRGPIALIENDTPSHIIAARLGGKKQKFRKSQRKSRAVLVGPFLQNTTAGRTPMFVTGSYTPGGLALFARHPGTKGQKPFARAVEAVEAVVPAHLARSLDTLGD